MSTHFPENRSVLFKLSEYCSNEELNDPGYQDVYVDGLLLSEGTIIDVKDSFNSKWFKAQYVYSHDNEVCARLMNDDVNMSWRYARYNH